MMFAHTYEAIIDAEINPEDIRGSRTGVFISVCFSDSETTMHHGNNQVDVIVITSTSRNMLAQNISYWLGVTGPSYNVDTACSSSLYAMENAYRAIRSGECDYAIVGASIHTCLYKVLNQNGHCKVFDEDANDYTRSKCVSVVFLQKVKTAKRIYATIIHAKTNCDGYKKERITFPSMKMQSTLLEKFYEECGVSTAYIPYMEVHGTGRRVGDPEELNSIDQIFTKNRANPLKIGSIKSNIRHTEAVNGICSIVKAIISMESGIIPPNINLHRLRKDLKSFRERWIDVVTKQIPLDGEYIAINLFGFGDANAHVLLKSNPKIKIKRSKDLMKFPTFAKAIEKCDAALKPRKLHIYEILTRTDVSILDNILHSFIGITATQMGLVELLDGSLTLEETILAAYSQGISVIEAKIPYCSVAVVGHGYKNLINLCPNDIDVVCHNGPESSTITGSVESLKAFVEKLQANEIFAKVVSEKKIPYQSRYITPAKSTLLANLRKVIPVAKHRSYKWLSTSVPRNEWSTSSTQYSFPEYLTNNLLKPVLFAQTLNLIPNNAVTIEITPDSQVHEILSKSLHKTVMNIAFTQKDHKDNVTFFLEGLGKLYNVGLQLDLAKLYSPVEYPVSRGTPMLSPLIRWEHSDDWFIMDYNYQEKLVSGERIITVTYAIEEFKYIKGHVVDGRNLFPGAGYLFLVWETLGTMIEKNHTEISIVMENIKFNRATAIPKKGKVEMVVIIQKGSGKFEVQEGNAIIITGTIRNIETNISKEKVPADVIKRNLNNEEEELNEKDIYKEFKLRGYQYSGFFKSIRSASLSEPKGHIAWKSNWAAFMDNMMQMKMINVDTRDLLVSTGIQKLVIDAKAHKEFIQSLTTNEKCKYNTYFERKVNATAIARKRPVSDPIIEEYKFTAYRDRMETSLREILTLSVHITLENIPMNKVKTIELVQDKDNVLAENLASPLVLDILNKLPLVQANVNVFTPGGKLDNIPEGVTVSELNMIETGEIASLAIGYDLLTNGESDDLKKLLKSTKDGGFILTREKRNTTLNLSTLQGDQLRVILEKSTTEELWILLRKTNKLPENTMIVDVNSNEFNWLHKVQYILARNEERKIQNTRIILVEEGNFQSGLLGFINCLQKEPGGDIFRTVLIQDLNAPKFSLNGSLYSKQLEIDLVTNVLRPGNIWGSYRHQLLRSCEPRFTYHAIIKQLVREDLNTIRWVEGPITKDYQDEGLISIHYASLNFKDVMLSTGKIEPEGCSRKDRDCVIGFEYSGKSITGHRIMGLNSNRCLSNFCYLDKTFSWTVPESWTLEDAATVPYVYCTCIAALYINGDMKKGDRILIHAGSGGIGQAAINLAFREGCEVFTTVGTPDKREFIKKTFPSIDDSHIGNSRDTSFEKMIFQGTNGAGVDIVLNSLVGFLVQDKAVVASMVVAEKRNKRDMNNVVDAVLNILCIKDLKNINPRTPLPELGMDSMSAVEIKQTLEREYEIYLTASDIRNLNFETLMGMNNDLMENNYSLKNDTNQALTVINILKQFYDKIHSNEIAVPLKTNPVEGRDEIFFLPGIEGYSDAFKLSESNIKSPATCFQFQTNHELKTIEAMANFVLPHILERLKDRKKFMLIGHSFGSLVAIELARMLEVKGFIGRLILIDGAPQYLKKFIQENLRSSSQEELENNILYDIINAYESGKDVELELELKKCNSWNEKLNAWLNILSPEHKELFSKVDQRNVIHSVYVRLQATATYNPDPKPYLRAPITLFKPLFPPILYASYDYELQDITEGKVDVHVVEGNHTTMLCATEIAMAINGELFECAATIKKT
ncbi:fatty acid synthase-like [Vespula maculifrons]|uniref:Fatty acid synthase-like n=1 Tax=Vespula maculifrons TaxID=7453 RepID=A0ABD2CT76_VESMC